jgi:hypothetical protein
MFFISSKSDFFSQVVLFRSRTYLLYLHQELNEQPKLILSKEQEHVARIHTRLKFKENSNPVYWDSLHTNKKLFTKAVSITWKPEIRCHLSLRSREKC